MKKSSAPDPDDADSLIPTWFPSCLALFAWAVLLLSLTRPEIPLNDQATGRHLASGSIVLEAGTVPKLYPLSYLHTDREYMNPEWFFDACLKSLYNMGGVSSIAYLTFVLFTITLCLLFQFLLKNGISLPLAFGGTLLMTMANFVHLLARPVIVTYFFLTLIIVNWTSVLNGKTQRFNWFLFPFIFALWANIHPGFAPALVYLGLSLAGCAWDKDQGLWTDLKKPALLFLLSAAATLVTPFGWNLHLLILHQVLHNKAISQVQEFLPPDFAHPNGAVGALMIVLVLGFFLGLRRGNKLRAQDVIPCLFFLLFALRVQRHILIFLPVVLLPFVRTLDQWLMSCLAEAWQARIGVHTRIALRARREWPWVLAGILVMGVLFHLAYASTLRIGASIFTPQAEAYIRSNIEKYKRPFTSSVQAGNFMFYFYPDLKVSFDDRADFYTDQEGFDYIAAVNMQRNWRDLMAKGNFDSALLYVGDPLAQGLRFEKDWKKTYEDSGLVIFERTAQPGFRRFGF